MDWTRVVGCAREGSVERQPRHTAESGGNRGDDLWGKPTVYNRVCTVRQRLSKEGYTGTHGRYSVSSVDVIWKGGGCRRELVTCDDEGHTGPGDYDGCQLPCDIGQLEVQQQVVRDEQLVACELDVRLAHVRKWVPAQRVLV